MGSETPKIDDFTVKMTKISPLAGQATTFGSDGSEFLISFGPLRNPTPQIGYPYPDAHDVPNNAPCPPLGPASMTCQTGLPAAEGGCEVLRPGI